MLLASVLMEQAAFTITNISIGIRLSGLSREIDYTSVGVKFTNL